VSIGDDFLVNPIGETINFLPPHFSSSDQAIYLVGQAVVQNLRISPLYMHAGPHPQARTESVPDLQGYVNGNAEPGGDSATLRSQLVMSERLVRDSSSVSRSRRNRTTGSDVSIAFIFDHDGCVQSHVVSCILVLTVCLITQLLSSDYPQWWPL